MDSAAMIKRVDELLGRPNQAGSVGHVTAVDAVVITKENLPASDLPEFKQRVAERLRAGCTPRFREFASTLQECLSLWGSDAS